ncbi:MAG: FkbM family methyltransferase [Candidatus Marinimicrobia bacterium]|jgi:FkbM family methyltransferase|nr:FkbM family methyltransferase [Candidatus Neomarinimicrobiota bacterium]MBT4947397.1 FkbM family methyltransferase [Candidatus Neomarinimicrobiota bacterium]MBT5271467.1 FkbM family methyltransferase [Candidatus Neomarinimicrobiota bacterium]MBT6011735.1 FkbM family methyltransferase [Candidatus Neomarinimicrobiota bacterium]
MNKYFHLISSIFSGHIKIHTGQWAEDLLVRKLVRKINTGVYVDIGAYHPFYHSNTAGLWLKGWHGINIDANKNTIKLFDRIRPNDTNIYSAILPKSEIGNRNTVPIMLPPKRDASSGISARGTCDADLGSKRGFPETTQVPVNDIESILSTNNITHIDYLNIDIEGCDTGVLHDINFRKYQPFVISVEDYANNIREIVKSEISVFMEENGYSLVSRAGPTSIFINQF